METYGRTLRKALERKDPVSPLRGTSLSSGGRTVILATLQLYAEFAGGGTEDDLKKALGSLPRRKPRESVPERPLSTEEWRRLQGSLGQEDEPLRSILRLLCTTGLRVRADIGRIEREKVKEALADGKTLYLLQKGNKYRPCSIKRIRAELETLVEYTDWEFAWQLLSKTSASSYYMIVHRALKRCAKRVGIDPARVHSHLLRKTVATELLRRTKGDLMGVKKFLGHKDIKTTQRYVAYVDPDELEEYADLLEED